MIISLEKRIMSANLQAEKILRMKLERGKPFDISGVVTEEYRAQAEIAIQEAFDHGHSYSNLVAKLSLHSGMPVSLVFSINPLYDNDDHIIGVVLTFRDNELGGHLTDKSSQSQLIGYDTLFEQLAEGVFTINNRWRITSFNRQAQAITGFTREEVLGKNCWDIFRSDLCRSSCPLKITMETGIVRMDQDVRIVAKGGQQRSILVNTSVIKNNRGLVIGAVETFRPLTLTISMKEGQLSPQDYMGQIVGESRALRQILQLVPDVAAADVTVIIEGESGTGKELVAKAIHQQSPRSSGPFIPVNCSALAETLLESELFGHVKGAFTGAVNSKVGRFELAKGGTLFLDEIGEIKPEIQIKLLRVLEERVFERVGGTRPIPLDTRIIAATNKTLLREVREGRFREDLFYRLRTVPLYLPPLRERKSDIPLLVNHFVSKFNKKYGKQVRGIDPKALKLFHQYLWPGNIREMERAMEYAFVFVKGPIITFSHLPEFTEATDLKNHSERDRSARSYLWEDEKTTIEDVLRKTKGRRDEAANILGISRTSLWRKMKAHGIG
ncbi:MAG: sigma 54-interacting transcriptional regulator [Deltaproteobacteria bacterium]|nr:sigma 54-interacting transcriptional regulator [Deltaproteobacteria bacterium]